MKSGHKLGMLQKKLEIVMELLRTLSCRLTFDIILQTNENLWMKPVS